MPYKPKKPCAYPCCPNLTNGRYCEEHAKQEAKRYNHIDRDPEANKRYGRSWAKYGRRSCQPIRFASCAMLNVNSRPPCWCTTNAS